MRWLIPLLALAAILQSLTIPGLTANGVRPDLTLLLVIGWASIRGWEEGYVRYLQEKHSGLLAEIKENRQIDDGIKNHLEAAIMEYKGKKA